MNWAIMRGCRLLRILIVTSVLVVAVTVGGEGHGQAQENRLGFGTDLGFWAGTSNDTVFALGFNLDYFLDPAFSLGGMVLLAPTGDLTQIAFAPVGRFHINLNPVNIVPFAGFGFVNANLDRGEGPGSIDRTDTSFYIPLGATLEFPVSRKIALASTLIVNIHDLNFDPPVGRDQTSVALLFGFRFGP